MSGWRHGKNRYFPVLAALSVLAALGWAFIGGPRQVEPEVRTTTRLLMGTLVSISTWQVPEAVEAEALSRAFDEMARVEALMSHHRPESVVSRVNATPRGAWLAVPEELAALLKLGLAVLRDSAGAFDMGLAPLTGLWGFSRQPPPEAPPGEAALSAWLRARPPGPGIEVAGDRVRLLHESVGLDLGGIAKGWAIDRAVMVLRRAGIENALVNAGGDMRALGGKGAQPWRIGIQHPRRADEVAAVSRLQGRIHGEVRENLAMVTSGDYERFFNHGGQRFHHILDPRSGSSARSGLLSVSVQAADAVTADALCTALFVLGAEAGLAMLERYPGAEALLMFADGTHRMTPGFAGEWLEK